MHSERLEDGMTGPEADRILAVYQDSRELVQALHRASGVPADAAAWLRAMQGHMGPLVDQARAMRAPADEIDPDEAREAARDARWAQ